LCWAIQPPKSIRKIGVSLIPFQLGRAGRWAGGVALVGREELGHGAARPRAPRWARARTDWGGGRLGFFPFLLFICFLFPSFCLFLFLFLVLSYFLHDVKLNSLLNPCSIKSLIKQSESMLQHDATIKALKGFQFTRLTCRYKTK
jgi:hypothetical protein